MIKKEITYTNPINGEEQTGTYLFHLNKADIIRLVGRDREGDWEKYVENIVQRSNSDEIMDLIETTIRASVGYRNADGAFVKNKAFADEFIASEAYGELFVEFITKPETARTFFDGVVGVNSGGNSKPAHIHSNRHKNNKRR